MTNIATKRTTTKAALDILRLKSNAAGIAGGVKNAAEGNVLEAVIGGLQALEKFAGVMGSTVGGANKSLNNVNLLIYIGKAYSDIEKYDGRIQNKTLFMLGSILSNYVTFYATAQVTKSIDPRKIATAGTVASASSIASAAFVLLSLASEEGDTSVHDTVVDVVNAAIEMRNKMSEAVLDATFNILERFNNSEETIDQFFNRFPGAPKAREEIAKVGMTILHQQDLTSGEVLTNIESTTTSIMPVAVGTGLKILETFASTMGESNVLRELGVNTSQISKYVAHSYEDLVNVNVIDPSTHERLGSSIREYIDAVARSLEDSGATADADTVASLTMAASAYVMISQNQPGIGAYQDRSKAVIGSLIDLSRASSQNHRLVAISKMKNLETTPEGVEQFFRDRQKNIDMTPQARNEILQSGLSILQLGLPPMDTVEAINSSITKNMPAKFDTSMELLRQFVEAMAKPKYLTDAEYDGLILCMQRASQEQIDTGTVTWGTAQWLGGDLQRYINRAYYQIYNKNDPGEADLAAATTMAAAAYVNLIGNQVNIIGKPAILAQKHFQRLILFQNNHILGQLTDEQKAETIGILNQITREPDLLHNFFRDRQKNIDTGGQIRKRKEMYEISRIILNSDKTPIDTITAILDIFNSNTHSSVPIGFEMIDVFIKVVGSHGGIGLGHPNWHASIRNLASILNTAQNDFAQNGQISPYTYMAMGNSLVACNSYLDWRTSRAVGIAQRMGTLGSILSTAGLILVGKGGSNNISLSIPLLVDLVSSVKGVISNIFANNLTAVNDYIDQAIEEETQTSAVFDNVVEEWRAICPIVLDLDNDGLELTDAQISGVHFDLDADGIAERRGWVAADDGLLVVDRNGNGLIDDGSELFGEYSPINDGEEIAKDGFSALSDFDTNSDNVIDGQDQDYGQLKVWRDLNQDGRSSEDELSSLVDLGISEINLHAHSVDRMIEGNHVFLTSDFTWSNGETGEISDVRLARDPDFVQAIDQIEANGSQEVPAPPKEPILLSNNGQQLVQAMASFSTAGGNGSVANHDNGKSDGNGLIPIIANQI